MRHLKSSDRRRKGDSDGQSKRIITKPSDPRWASEFTLKADYVSALRYVIWDHYDPISAFSASDVLREIEFRNLPIYVRASDAILTWAVGERWIVALGTDVYRPLKGGIEHG